MSDFLQSLISGAVGAGLVAGIFTLLGKGLDHAHEDRRAKMDDNKKLKQDVSKLQEDITHIQTKLETLEANDRALMKAVNALLLHTMTGNATGKMAKAQEELTTYIIEHGGE